MVPDDRGAFDELVAVAVVAVVVGVDDLADGEVGDRPDGREEVAGEVQVEEGVDQDRFVVADDEPGVRPAPASIGLEERVRAVTDLDQTPRILHERDCTQKARK
jgi:hypothetical protein